MDTLPEIIGVGRTVEMAGRTWHLMPLRCRDYAEAAEVIRNGKTKPLAAVANLLPAIAGLAPDQHAAALKQLLTMAYQDEREGDLIAQYETQRWLDHTPIGNAHRHWFWFRQKHPELTLDQVHLMMESEGERRAQEAERLAKLAADLDGMPRGNCSGGESPPSQTPTAGQPVGLGELSTAT